MILDQGDDHGFLECTLPGELPGLPLRRCADRHRETSDDGELRQHAAFRKSRASNGPDSHRSDLLHQFNSRKPRSRSGRGGSPAEATEMRLPTSAAGTTSAKETTIYLG